MKFAVSVLKEYLNNLEAAYDKHVVNGVVSRHSTVAKQNRKNTRQIKKAINLLTNKNKQDENKD